MAVPVVVSSSVRGVLYGATRASTPLGDRAADAMASASRQLATELALRDEVDRRMGFLLASETGSGHGTSHSAAEEVRELHAELRAIAQAVHDETLRDRLLAATRRLADLGAAPEPEQEPAIRSRLSPREIDVLAQVALGCTNVEAAARLSLKPETVKAYLRSAMRKLDARTRFEAVVAARRGRLLP